MFVIFYLICLFIRIDFLFIYLFFVIQIFGICLKNNDNEKVILLNRYVEKKMQKKLRVDNFKLFCLNYFFIKKC